MYSSKNLIPLGALRAIYAWVIYNIMLSGERKGNQFLTYPVSEFHVVAKVLVRNHVRDV